MGGVSEGGNQYFRIDWDRHSPFSHSTDQHHFTPHFLSRFSLSVVVTRHAFYESVASNVMPFEYWVFLGKQRVPASRLAEKADIDKGQLTMP